MTEGTPRPRLLLAVLVAVIASAVAVRGDTFPPFTSIQSGYSDVLFGATSSFLNAGGYLGGIVTLQNGDVVAAECVTSGTRLHRFIASSPFPSNGATLHTETIVNVMAGTTAVGGCGLVPHPDTFLYSNDGVKGIVRINPTNGAATTFSVPKGNALGLAVDPQQRGGVYHIIYAADTCRQTSPQLQCKLIDFDPALQTATTLKTFDTADMIYLDGMAFDPNGQYMFLAERTTNRRRLVVVDRAGNVVQKVGLTSFDPVGLGFHQSPNFVILTNQLTTTSGNQSMWRFDFPGDNYAQAPTMTLFASGGYRGDMMQAGPDGCVYVTQAGVKGANTSDNDPTPNGIVRVCGGFATPPGITPNPPPAPSSICGFVYNDVNNNGSKENGDAGIGGVTINLSGSDFLALPVTLSTTTSDDGRYCFNNLLPGTYAVSETQPANYLDGRDTPGTPSGSSASANDTIANIQLPAGTNGANNNFGELKPASLSGYVYGDKNNDGTLDINEQGIANVSITLTGTDDRGTAINMAGATGSEGLYSFAQLRPGTYTITETQPAGYLDGKDTPGTPGGGTTGNDAFSGVPLNPGVNGTNNNFGEIPPAPAITMSKKTNGSKNDKTPGLYVPVGTTVTWTYVITNTGNELLSSIVLRDDKIGLVACPATTLDIGLSMTCTATGASIAGQYTNTGTVTAADPLGTTVTASDKENYFGSAPAMTIVKKTNDTDNDAAPGLNVPAGSPITWTYTFTNTGNVALSNVTVTDNKITGTICSAASLAIGASLTCTKTGTAIAGQYTNIGTVTAKDPAGQTVTASNPDNYFGSAPAMTIVKKTNDKDNDAAPGQNILAGTPVTWSYTATNTGNVALSNVTVTDNKITGTICSATSLEIGASLSCTKTGTAIAGQYTNIGTVTAKDPAGQTVTASNPDNYFGVNAAVSIVKKTNGTDNNSGTGPVVNAGSTVTWTYTITNSGNAALSGITLVDNKAGAVACPMDTLAPAAAMTCTKTGTAILGQYTNTGTVKAKDPLGNPVSAQDTDRYLGVQADLGVTATAPAAATSGGTFTYTMNVINNGPSTATDAVVAATLPTGMRVSALGTLPAGWTCVAAPSGTSVSCTKPAMAVAETAALTMTTSLACPFPTPAPAVSTLVATVTSSTADPGLANNTAIAAMSIINPAPAISGLAVDKPVLWPPNHKMEPITVSYTVTPACGGTPIVKLDLVSNEGDASDWQVDDLHHVDVRSERLGTQKEGRVYTITLTATDPTGTRSTKDVTVTVPHDQGDGN